MSYPVKLSSLRTSRPISRWKRAWGCEWCDGDVYGPLSEEGDGVDHANDNLACPRCGYVHTFDVDYDGDPVARLTTERLRPAALAALRRILRLQTDATWPDPWTGRACPECRGTGRMHHGNSPPDGEYCPCGWDEHLPDPEWGRWTSGGGGAGLVGCPTCGAEPGQQCSTRDGEERAAAVHAARADVVDEYRSEPARPAEEGGAQGSIPGLGREGPRGDAGRVRLPAPGVGQPLPNPEAVEGVPRGDLDGVTGARELPRVPSGGSPTSRLADVHRYTPGPGAGTFELPADVAAALKHCDTDRIREIGDAARAELRARLGAADPPRPGPADLLFALRELVGDDDERMGPNALFEYLRSALEHRSRAARWLGSVDVVLFDRSLTQEEGPAGEAAHERRLGRLTDGGTPGRVRSRRGSTAPPGAVSDAQATADPTTLLRVALYPPGAEVPIALLLPAVPRRGDQIAIRGADRDLVRGVVDRVVWNIGRHPSDPDGSADTARIAIWMEEG